MSATVERAASKARAETIVTIVGLCLTAVLVLGATALRLVNLFAAGGVSSEVQVPLRTASIAGADGPVDVGVWHAFVSVSDPSGALVLMAVLAVAAGTLTWLGALACVLALSVELLRGRPFSRRALRALSWLSAALVFGSTVAAVAESTAADRLRAEAGVGHVNTAMPAVFWVGLVGGIAVGLVTIAFRRGAVLQRETEGLV